MLFSVTESGVAGVAGEDGSAAGVSDDRLTRWTVAALGLAAVAVLVVWTRHDGGFAPEQWLPGGLALVGLLVVALASADARERLARAPVAPLLLGLYAAWSYASISWAQVRGDALDGANRTLLYACLFALFAAVPFSQRQRTALWAVWAGAVAVLAAIGLGSATAASGPRGHFVLGRLADPIAYSNADAAVFLMAALVLVVLASRREAHPLLRIVGMLGASFLVDVAVLSQSRGSLVALPLAVLTYVALARDRLRALLHVGVIAVAVAPALPRLLDVYAAVINGDGYARALSRASVAVAGSCAIAVAVTAVLCLLDRRLVVPDRVRAVVGRVVLLVGALAAVGLVAGFLLLGHGAGRLRTAWHDFSTSREPGVQTLHLASGTGTSRYDVWRIALVQFRNHPVTGVGADNYLVGYLQQQRTYQTSRYPQSIELRALSETGIVGALLFFAFLAFALRDGVAAARRESGPGVVLACLAAFSYWFFHASVDWLWEFPALAGPAFALLGTAAGARVRARPEGRSTRVPRPLAVGAGAAVAAGAIVVLGAPWISVRESDAALAVAPTDTGRAYALLRSAARWNPVSDSPALVEAAVAANARDREHEKRALRAALERNPWEWYSYFMLGIVAGQQHRTADARAQLLRAQRLAPRNLIVLFARRRLSWGKPLDEREAAAVLRETTRTLRGVTQR